MELPGDAVVLGSRALATFDGETVLLKFLATGVDIDEYSRARAALLSDDSRVIAVHPDRRSLGFAEAIGEMAVNKRLEFPLEGDGRRTGL